MKISFIVSGNGYGHLKRVCEVASQIFKLKPDAEIIVAGATSHVAILQEWRYPQQFANNRFSFIDTHLQNNLKAILPPRYSFDSYLHSFDLTLQLLGQQMPDVVISDNLAGILPYFPNVILMGSFLWSDTLLHKFPGNSEVERICQYEEKLLETHLPVMIGVEDMAMPYVKAKTKFIGLPWFCERDEKQKTKKQVGNILISGGGTQISQDQLLGIAEAMISDGQFTVWLDNSLFRNARSEWKGRVYLFDFSEEAFASLQWIVCRPGIGILTDAVRYQVPVCVLEERDKEILFNCERVEQMGIGLVADERPLKVCDQLRQKTHPFRLKLAERKTGGASVAAHYILNS